LYYEYGMCLAPLTAILTTARHIDLNDLNMSAVTKNPKRVAAGKKA